MTISNEEIIQQAMVDIAAGDRVAAREALAELLSKNSHQASAWYLFSQVVETPEEQIVCLEQAIQLWPENVQFRKRLELLKQTKDHSQEEISLQMVSLGQDNKKKCPFCAEEIREEATVCRYCGRDLPGTTATAIFVKTPQPEVKKMRVAPLALVSMIAVLVIIFCAIGSLGTNRYSTDRPSVVKPTTYAVLLSCGDCASIGMNINVWKMAGSTRGSVSFNVPHNTLVNVLGSKIADDDRHWYQVEYQGSVGWIPEDFVRR